MFMNFFIKLCQVLNKNVHSRIQHAVQSHSMLLSVPKYSIVQYCTSDIFDRSSVVTVISFAAFYDADNDTVGINNNEVTTKVETYRKTYTFSLHLISPLWNVNNLLHFPGFLPVFTRPLMGKPNFCGYLISRFLSYSQNS